MEMTMPKLAVKQSSSSSSAASTAKSNFSGGTEGFQKVLVQQIDNSKADSKPQTPLVANVTALIGGNESSAITEDANAAVDLASLLSLMDEWIDKLSGDSESDSSEEEESKDELIALNEQLNALLAMLGVPIVHSTDSNAVGNESYPGANDQLTQTSAAQLKSNLQDGLLQLQAVLSQSGPKTSSGQAGLLLVEQEVKSITDTLAGLTKSTNKQSEPSKPSTPDWLTPISTAELKDTVKQLQRLTQVTMNPLQQAASAQEIQTLDADAGKQLPVTMDSDSFTMLPMGVLQSSNANQMKDLTSQLNNQSAPTAFVLADDFADTMNGILVQKLQIQTLNGNSEAKLMLKPEHLGQVDVRLSMQNGILTAVFHTDTAAAKDLLDNQMAQLRASLQAQGLQVDKLQVTQAQPTLQFGGQPFNQQNNGQPFSRGQQGFAGGHNATGSFEEELDEQAAIQGLGYGRAINETA